MLLANAELDSMGGVGISSTPSPQQSSDLEKTQAELRQTFTAAEKFRRELEFLQKGGDPLDLKPGNATSISLQSTSITDRHREQFVTSEAKGSFAIAASPHGDSVDSSGRLGAPSVCEPNSADNLMLLKESGDSAVLELPKKSYKRRIRSRPNRDPLRHVSREFKGLSHDVENPERNHFSNSNSNPKSPNSNVALKNELDIVPAVQSNLGPAHGPYSAVSEAKSLQNPQENHHEAPLTLASIETESLGGAERDSKCPTNGFGNTEELKSVPDPTKVLDSESSCTQNSQRFGNYNGNGVLNTVPMEQNSEGNDLGAEKNDKILNVEKANSDICRPAHNEDVKEEEGLKGADGCTDSKTERKPNLVTGPNPMPQVGNACSSRPQGSNNTLNKLSTGDAEQNTLKLATKEHEDSILEEARIIEAKRKRIAELSIRTLPLERRIKSHWDFVLEEMSWLANDFAQERLWKVTAAAQISRRVAFASHVRSKQQSSLQKLKEVSHSLAEAVTQFWNSIQVKSKGQESLCLKKDDAVGIQGYAMRFLEYNNSQAQCNATQAHVTPDIASDLDIIDHSWEDNLTEENLFYTVPPGAIEAYRKAINSHLLQFERTGSSMQEEVDTSCYDAVADNTFEEDEGETSTYDLPGGFEGSNSTKTTQKRRKNFKFYGPKSYETGGDVSFLQSAERNIGNHPSVLSGKRSGSNLNVVIPTKRVRTASRQRIISPFHAGTSGHIQALNKTDASSADTNSFQDEQSTLHGVSQMANNLEAESAGDYEKQLQFDSMEVSNRPKKRKKGKHPGSTFDHRWQLDSNFQNDQKDHSRRRLDVHQFDSNGSSVASQMSNMSNPNKFMKLLVRDRSRKVKALKTPVGQQGSGSPWSLFEDQALVVLVHDMGPNWELISDAINSTLQFKCIFRKPKECKERHRILMDRNPGDGADGADSAEDSGSSQPYPSTLPGIPEGSARQLFQRLQGPMEEDTLKSHFEKIIMIGQKQHYRRTQNDNQDPKQLQQPHNSHAYALSQVCPNNLNGGHVLTPLELAEALSPSPDVLPVYQGPHSGGLPAMNHGSVAPMLPGSGSGSTSSAPGSSNSVHGSSLPSASAPLNPSAREGRYGIPRTGSLSVDDQQRMQQYNQMLSARNAQQSGLPPGSHSVTDRGVRMLPAGNGMGVMCGVNRNMKMVRPGYQGLSSPSMLASATPTPTSASIHSAPGQGNSVLRPRDPMHMMRPNQNSEQQSGSTQGVPSFGSGTSSSFPNQLSQQTYPPRPISPQQLNSNSHHPHHFQGPPPNHPSPAYAMRLVKERQLQQQRLLQQQQQQQFSTSNPMMPPHVQQPQDSQLAVSSPQNTNTARSSSPPVSIPPMGGTPPMTPKHPVVPPAPHGLARNPQTVKQQRPRQPPQQFQHQAKLMKGVRGNMMHQTLPTDSSSLVNGFSGGQSTAADKGHVSLHPGSSATGAGKQAVAPHSSSSLSQPHQLKTFSGQIQAKKPFDSSSDNTKNQSNHHQQHQLNQKLVNQKQASTAPSPSHKVLLNRKVNNTSDQTTTSKQAVSSSMSFNTTSSQATTAVLMPSCNDANSSENPVVSSAAASDKTGTHFGKNSARVSQPQTNSVGVDSEHSGPAMNPVMAHRQSSSSDSLPNPDVGVQQQPPS